MQADSLFWDSPAFDEIDEVDVEGVTAAFGSVDIVARRRATGAVCPMVVGSRTECTTPIRALHHPAEPHAERVGPALAGRADYPSGYPTGCGSRADDSAVQGHGTAGSAVRHAARSDRRCRRRRAAPAYSADRRRAERMLLDPRWTSATTAPRTHISHLAGDFRMTKLHSATAPASSARPALAPRGNESTRGG